MPSRMQHSCASHLASAQPSAHDNGNGCTTWLGSQDTLRTEETLARQDAIDRYDARRDAIGR